MKTKHDLVKFLTEKTEFLKLKICNRYWLTIFTFNSLCLFHKKHYKKYPHSYFIVNRSGMRPSPLILCPQMGLLYQSDDRWIRSISGIITGRGKLNCLEKNLSWCHLVHHKPPHRLPWNWTWDLIVRIQQLATWAMAWSTFMLTLCIILTV